MLFNPKNTGLLSVIVIFLSLNFAVSDLSYSQNPGIMFMKDRTGHYKSTNAKPKSVSRSEVKDLSVKGALEFISYKTGLTLSYRSGLFPDSKEVSLNLIKMNAEEAIDKVLYGTDLRYEITETRHLVIYEREKIGHIKGNVADVYNYEPLAGAKVLLVHLDDIQKPGLYRSITKRTKVDSSGQFSIKNVEAGTYRLIVIDNGYKKIYKKVQIEDNKTTVEYFRLEYPRQ